MRLHEDPSSFSQTRNRITQILVIIALVSGPGCIFSAVYLAVDIIECNTDVPEQVVECVEEIRS